MNVENAIPNEAYRISVKKQLFRAAAALAFGILGAAALPPLNWSLLVLVTLAGLVGLALRSTSWRGAALCGFLWGLGRNFCAFYWLREIEPFIPYLLAPVLAVWTTLFAAPIPFLRDHLLTPVEVKKEGFQGVEAFRNAGGFFGRNLLFAVTLSAWWMVMAWSLSRLLPWNGLEVAFWRNPAAFQIVSFTGAPFLAFLLAFFNTALALALWGKFRGGALPTLLVSALLLALALLAGMLLLLEREKQPPAAVARVAVIQSNLTISRHPTERQTVEALDVHFALSREADQKCGKESVIIWPESAIPVPLRNASPLGAEFRRRLQAFLAETHRPMLIGTIDFGKNFQTGETGVTNAAVYFDPTGAWKCKHDKFHRVPYGEYIPFRRYLPAWLTDRIDLGRDLVPGQTLEPIPFDNGICAGTAICFEGSFAYVMNAFARRNANALLVLINEDWYPESCEPEMHLANSVMRSTETLLPMVRSANNGVSGVVTPTGRFEQCVETGSPLDPVVRRGRGWRELVVPLSHHEPTFYAKYGEWFWWLYFFAAVAGFTLAADQKRREERLFWHKEKNL